MRGSHQRNLSRSLSIIAPHVAPASSHTYVPSRRTSQFATPSAPASDAATTQQPPTPVRVAALTADTPAAPAAAAQPSAARPSTANPIHRASLTGFDGGSYKVLLVGAAHSGKTSLLRRLIAAQFSDDEYAPTPRIELSMYLLRDERFSSFELWELPSSAHVEEALQPLYMQGAHCAVIVADLTDLRSFVDIGHWLHHFASASASASPSLPFPCVLLANKCDSPDRVLSDASVAEWADRHRLAHACVVSAKTGAGVEEAFRGLVPRIEQFVPAASGGLEATQRLLSLLHTTGPGRRSPSHSPSASHRPSASLTPTSRTSLSVQSLLSTLPPSAAPRTLQPSASPRMAVGGVNRSPAHSYSALTVQRLTAAGSHFRPAGASVSLLARPDARERENSRSVSAAHEEKEWAPAGLRKQPHMPGGAATATPFQKQPLAVLHATTAAGGRPAPYSPSAKEVDLRF